MDHELLKKMRNFLTENGFKAGCYNATWDTIHTIGIPKRTYYPVRPNWSPVDGASVLLVTSDKVMWMTLAIPYNSSSWKNHRGVKSYETQVQLLDILNELVNEPNTAWK